MICPTLPYQKESTGSSEGAVFRFRWTEGMLGGGNARAAAGMGRHTSPHTPSQGTFASDTGAKTEKSFMQVVLDSVAFVLFCLLSIIWVVFLLLKEQGMRGGNVAFPELPHTDCITWNFQRCTLPPHPLSTEMLLELTFS